MDEIAGIKIVVEAEDRASAVISGVSSSVTDLGRAESVLNGQSSALNAAVNGSTKGVAVMGTSVDRAKNNLKQLESSLEQQKKTTLEYTKSLRDSATTLREKQAAVQNAAKAYKTNTASIRENISGLENQRTHLDALTSINNQIISRAQEQNKSLKKNSTAYKENAETIRRVKTENTELASQRREITRSITDNEAALKHEEKTYKDAQIAVKNASAAREEMRNNLKQSKASEADYQTVIDKTNAALEKQQREYEKIQKAESLIETGGSWKKVGGAVDDITKPIQYVAAATAVLGTASAMAAVSFEDNFASVKKTVEGTPEELEKIRQEIIDMSTVGINGHSAIPQTTAELTELAAAGGQLGIKTENISDFTEKMAMLGSATNLAGEQGAQTLARFMNVTNTSQNEVGNLGSAIVDLGNNFATTEAEIADMALNMGATGNVVGISAQDVLAYSTALSSLGVDAAAGGSAVSRIWMDIQSAVAEGGEDLQKFAKLSGKSADEFKKKWQTDASGAFQDFLKGLNQDKDQISTLADLGFNNIRDIQALQRLAGEKGFNLLTEAIERSNTAWEENTALQTEFDAKAETTASQLKIAKNNAIEAARSFGEIMLPSIVSVTGSVSSFTQSLAKMSDGGKKAVVTTGAVVVGLGALSKGAASTIKTVGGVIEGYGTIKKAMTAGGVLAKFAPALTAIGSAAGPAAIGLAAVGTAVVIAKKSYDMWYDSQYRWSEGLSEGNEKVSESLDKYKKLSDIQGQIKDLKLIIENPESSKEQVNDAKSKLEEIKKLLSEEYNLVINSDNFDLEDTVDKLTQKSKNELQYDINNQMERLQQLKPKFDEYKSNSAKYQEEADAALELQTAFSSARIALQAYQFVERDGESSEAAHYRQIEEKRKIVDGYFKDIENGTDILNKYINLAGSIESGLNSGYDAYGKEFTTANDKLTDLETSYEEYIDVLNELANSETELIKRAALNKDGEGIQKALQDMQEFIKLGKLDMSDYAQKAALAMNGIDSLQTAWEQAWSGDNTALTGIVKDYIRSMKEFGASAQETAVGASLIQNGFRTIEEAAEKGELDVVTQQANELAHSMGLIPDDKHIVINANGDISIIEDVQSAVDKVNENSDVKLAVSATGDVSVLETADEKLQELINNKQVTVTFNAKTNGFDISNLQGDKIGQITADGKINWTQGEIEKPKDEKADGTIDYKLGEVAKPENAVAEGTINYKIGRVEKPKENARGTQNFSGGLAMVNDDGRADPRELIIDRGRAFIPEGRDVVLPLSKGAKVYTSSQTKAIMSGLGIPRYASGKDNSDAFTSAKDDWSHYTKTHSVTTAQELQKWVQLSEQFRDNEKDIADIEEQIFSLRQKMAQEMNKQSKAYLSERSALNDWEDVGDSALDAFGRIRDRNKADLDAMRITYDEYVDNVSDAGKTLYEGMLKQSDQWLTDQVSYYNMSADEYIAGINREQARLEEFYAADMLKYSEYVEYKRDLRNKELDAIAEKNADEYTAWKKDADAWQEMRSTYGDWDYQGDSEEDFLKRKIQRAKEFYEAGKISFEEFIDDTNQYSMDLYKAQEGYIDDLLKKQQDYISDMREQFQKEEQALRDSWTVADRKADMSEVQGQLDIYAGAVTDRGQQKYKELQEQMKQLQRDEELYQLQVRNNATIEGLEADYKILEENKKNILDDLRATDIDISGYVESLTQSVSQSGKNVEGLLSTLINKFDNFKIENNSMSDNRSITNIINNLSSEQYDELADYFLGR